MTMSDSAAATMAEKIVEFYVRAGGNAELSERMSFARTSVHIYFTEDESAGVTIWLDRNPITAELGIVGDAEIELFATVDAFMQMVEGKENLAISIVKGQVTYTGPVRKYLRVVPILSSFDFDMWRDPEGAAR